MTSEACNVSSAGEGGAAEAWREQPASGSRSDAVRKLLAMVQRFAASALGVERAELEDPLRRFADLGLNSLAAVELHRLIQAEIGISFPLTDIYDHPTASSLAHGLAVHLLGEETAAQTVVGGSAADASDPVVIVGTACRTPGGVSTPEELWQQQPIMHGRAYLRVPAGLAVRIAAHHEELTAAHRESGRR